MKRIMPLLVSLLFVVGCVEGIVDHYVEKFSDDVEEEIEEYREESEPVYYEPECPPPCSEIVDENGEILWDFFCDTDGSINEGNRCLTIDSPNASNPHVYFSCIEDRPDVVERVRQAVGPNSGYVRLGEERGWGWNRGNIERLCSGEWCHNRTCGECTGSFPGYVGFPDC